MAVILYMRAGLCQRRGVAPPCKQSMGSRACAWATARRAATLEQCPAQRAWGTVGGWVGKGRAGVHGMGRVQRSRLASAVSSAGQMMAEGDGVGHASPPAQPVGAPPQGLGKGWRCVRKRCVASSSAAPAGDAGAAERRAPAAHDWLRSVRLCSGGLGAGFKSSTRAGPQQLPVRIASVHPQPCAHR